MIPSKKKYGVIPLVKLIQDSMNAKIETIVLGGGCFWCTEAAFAMIKGVESVMPGYAGGEMPNPDYEAVSAGTTGHAEVIKVTFDPEKISFQDILTVFFATHDPTTLNRQGNDRGPQYRSIILYTTEKQKELAESTIKEINESNSHGAPAVTEVKPLDHFYEAETYHQKYYEKNLDKPYCQLVINPKLEKIKKKFVDLVDMQKAN